MVTCGLTDAMGGFELVAERAGDPELWLLIADDRCIVVRLAPDQAAAARGRRRESGSAQAAATAAVSRRRLSASR